MLGGAEDSPINITIFEYHQPLTTVLSNCDNALSSKCTGAPLVLRLPS